MRRTVCAALSLLVAGAGPAAAEVVQIPAATFVHNVDSFETDEADKGLLTGSNAGDFLYAPAPFFGTGNVCRFSMVFQDGSYVDEINISAALYKKTVRIGSPAKAGAVVMAKLTSEGLPRSEVVQRVTTTSIKSPKVDTAKDFYFVRVEKDPGSGDLEFIGLQIEVKSAC